MPQNVKIGEPGMEYLISRETDVYLRVRGEIENQKMLCFACRLFKRWPYVVLAVGLLVIIAMFLQERGVKRLLLSV